MPLVYARREWQECEGQDLANHEPCTAFIGIQLSAQRMIELNNTKLYKQHQTSIKSAPTATVSTESLAVSTLNADSPQTPQSIGTILLTCSASGLRSRSGFSAYTMSKFAVRGLTIAAAQELGNFGIRVNAVCPGLVDTPLLRGAGLEDEKIGKEGAMGEFGLFCVP